MADFDENLVLDMGMHAAHQAFESMVAVLDTLPRVNRLPAMAVAFAYTLHKIDGACLGPTEFSEVANHFKLSVEEMRQAFNKGSPKYQAWLAAAEKGQHHGQ